MDVGKIELIGCSDPDSIINTTIWLLRALGDGGITYWKRTTLCVVLFLRCMRYIEKIKRSLYLSKIVKPPWH